MSHVGLRSVLTWKRGLPIHSWSTRACDTRLQLYLGIQRCAKMRSNCLVRGPQSVNLEAVRKNTISSKTTTILKHACVMATLTRLADLIDIQTGNANQVPYLLPVILCVRKPSAHERQNLRNETSVAIDLAPISEVVSFVSRFPSFYAYIIQSLIFSRSSTSRNFHIHSSAYSSTNIRLAFLFPRRLPNLAPRYASSHSTWHSILRSRKLKPRSCHLLHCG